MRSTYSEVTVVLDSETLVCMFGHHPCYNVQNQANTHGKCAKIILQLLFK